MDTNQFRVGDSVYAMSLRGDRQNHRIRLFSLTDDDGGRSCSATGLRTDIVNVRCRGGIVCKSTRCCGRGLSQCTHIDVAMDGDVRLRVITCRSKHTPRYATGASSPGH